MTEHVLFVCTGNLCRSPMAEALFRRHLEERSRPEVLVTSAGTRAAWSGATPHAQEVVAAMGADLEGHRARRADRGVLLGADLIVVMTADHVIDVVHEAADVTGRVFKLTELVRRVGDLGVRSAGESLGAYVARLHEGRSAKPWVDSNADADIPDPMGESVEFYRDIATRIDVHLGPIADALWPAP